MTTGNSKHSLFPCEVGLRIRLFRLEPYFGRIRSEHPDSKTLKRPRKLHPDQHQALISPDNISIIFFISREEKILFDLNWVGSESGFSSRVGSGFFFNGDLPDFHPDPLSVNLDQTP